MKRHLILAAAALFVVPTMAMAQRGGPGDRGRGPDRTDERLRGADLSDIWTDPERREEMYERLKERVGEERAAEIRQRMEAEYTRRFDTDGDGTVTDAEREKVTADWQKQMAERRAEWQKQQEIRRWDEDRDGELSEAELAKKEAADKAEAEALKAKTEAMVKEYDTDKDGELSPEEIKAMREKLEKMLTHIADVSAVAGAKARQGDNQYEGIVRSIEEARRGGPRGGDPRRGGDDRPPFRGGDRPAAGEGPGPDGPPPPPRPRRPLTGE